MASSKVGKQILGKGSRAWLVYLLVGLAATGSYLLLPSKGTQNVLYVLIGFSAVIVILVGVRSYRPVPPLPWYVLAFGLLTFVLGDAIWTFYENVLGLESPFPSVADAFYLVALPLVAMGLWLMLRERAPGYRWAGIKRLV
jgi:uncharacterized membrane protein YuzA (DUF378 family)